MKKLSPKAVITADFTKAFIAERIAINSISDCWEWTSRKDGDGYGRIGGRVSKTYSTYQAHRVSYIAYNGCIPDAHVVRHRCNNRSCVNPAHLQLGTIAQNNADKSESIAHQTTPSLLLLEIDLASKLDAVRKELLSR